MDFSQSNMFSAIVIHSGSNRSHILRYLVATADCLEVARDFDHTPTEHELRRIIGTMDPEVAIIDLFHSDSVLAAQHIREISPTMAIIGFGASLNAAISASSSSLFDALLPQDAPVEDFRAAIHAALRKLRGGIESNLYCFLPAKAGGGCSTIVMNTASALAREQGKRVLVLDADLRSGIQAILLGTEPLCSLQTLLAKINHLDRRRFPEMVYSVGGVDYLLSSRSLDSQPPDWADYFHLLATVRGMYDAILVDLPELVNPATFELVRRAQTVYVTCTPEIPSLTLAKHRILELTRIKIPRTRIGLLANRWHRSDLSPAEISSLVGHDVSKIFPNDYNGVRSAILSGKAVSSRSRLGTAYAEFAAELFDKHLPPAHSLTGKLKSLWGIRESVQTG